MSENQEEKKTFSETATEFIKEVSEKKDEELKIENQPADQQIEFIARFFHMYMPIFKQKIQKLNKKALIRVLERLVEHPLNEKALKWPFQEEKDIFLIGDRLLESKYAMYKYVINDEIQKAKETKALEEKKEGEDNNGKAQA